jgi:hypothetical protein
MQHSNIVGGSTAKRVINCPGSVALVQKMPPKPSSKYADEGTLLHNVMAELIMGDEAPEHYLGTRYEDQILTQELIDNKIKPALEKLKLKRVWALVIYCPVFLVQLILLVVWAIALLFLTGSSVMASWSRWKKTRN